MFGDCELHQHPACSRAQIIVAVQMCVEEVFVGSKDVHPLMAVGLEVRAACCARQPEAWLMVRGGCTRWCGVAMRWMRGGCGMSVGSLDVGRVRDERGIPRPQGCFGMTVLGFLLIAMYYMPGVKSLSETSDHFEDPIDALKQARHPLPPAAPECRWMR